MIEAAPSNGWPRYFDEERETMPRAQLDALIEQQLIEQVHYAYEHAALIRETWDEAGVRPRDIRSLDDFREKAPFINKDALRRYRDEKGDPYGGLLCVPESALTCINSTSGTTGDPTLNPEKWDLSPLRGGLSRDFWEMGVRPGDFICVPMFTFRGPIHTFPSAIGATAIVFDHTPTEIPRIIELLERYRPSGWYSMSTPLLLGFRQLEQDTGVDLRAVFESLGSIVFSGEPLGVRARADLERWGLRKFEHASLGDAGAVFECREHDGMHFWEDSTFVEHLDPDGASPVPDGTRGELVVTALLNKVMPLIRYRSDDIVRITKQPCPCGRTHGRQWVMGRKGDEVLVQGQSILPTAVWSAVETLDETQSGLFQIIRPQREVDVLRLRVGYRGTPSLADLRDRLVDVVEQHAGVRPEVELVPEADLLKLGPPHKIPRVTKA